MIERMGMHKVIVAAVFVAAVAGSAATSFAKEVNERRPVDADGEITIKNVNGTITVTGWSKNEVEVTGTYTGDVEAVAVEGTTKRMRVEARWPQHSRNSTGSADLVIKAPVGAGIRVDVVNADVTVGGVGGEVEVEAVNGDITVSDRPARLSVQTVNGVITVRGKCGHVEAQTVGGRINLDGVEGDVSAEAVGGEIQVTGNSFGRVKMSSVSGSIDFTGGFAKNAVMQAESHNGDITLRLPANVSAEFEASSFSGDFRNAFGSNGTKSQYGPGRTLNFTAGDGDARVSITTFNGDVELIKK